MNRHLKIVKITVALSGAALLLVGAFLYRVPLASWVLANSNEKVSMASPGQTEHDQKASTKPGEQKVLYWYDPMNPAHRSDTPGKSSDGMDLVPMTAETAAPIENMPPGSVKISSVKQQLIGVRTDIVKREPLDRTIRAVAQVQVDETKIAKIHVKFAGWVEQVNVDFIGKLVRKGEPLFILYSPELGATQQEYLIARRATVDLGTSPFPEVAKGSESLFLAARERLRLWDINDEQINELNDTGEVSRTMTLYSPIDGFVMKREVYPKT